jgi:hypothetical protein
MKKQMLFSPWDTRDLPSAAVGEYESVFVMFLHPLFLYFHSAGFGTHFLRLKKF